MNRRDALIAAVPLLAGTSALRAAAVPMPMPMPMPTDASITARLRAGGVAVLLRHAITDPGIGDPAGFKLGVCSTQRNLSAEGRAQAQRIGAWFKTRGLVATQVRSSAWCRCVDTGTLAFGRANPWEALNSFFDEAKAQQQQTATLRSALSGIGAGSFEVWLTHQVNITALTGEFPQMSEAFLVGPPVAGAPIHLIGRFNPGG